MFLKQLNMQIEPFTKTFVLMGLSPSKDKEDLVFKASEESQLLDFVDSLKMG